MKLLPVSPLRQQQQADCLAACASMVLAYLGVPIPYSQLLRLLRVDKIGTPFRNLRYLESFQLSVTIATGNMATLREQLRQGHPSTTHP
jgi:ABC-type bacteriocin/lantibiotic exporter with double-glycine peptidase domain